MPDASKTVEEKLSASLKMVPSVRIRPINEASVDPGGDYVLYWMIASRRLAWSFALDHAVDLARELGKPLVIFEALRAGYRWASERIHRFVIDGMRDNQRRLANRPVVYYPYLEPEPGAGKGLLAALASRAAAVVTDRFPCFFLPRMVAAAGAALEVAAVEVDGNGLYPLDATERVFSTAASFRRHLQAELPSWLGTFPRRRPLAGFDTPAATLPREIRRRWPPADLDGIAVGSLPIDHQVAPPPIAGGALAAVKTWRRFLRGRLDRYGADRDPGATSGLSPYLHFGHISAHQIASEILEADGWSPERLAERPTGSRRGWWGASEPVEVFLDELITWRELGYNMSARVEGYDRYESLPGWALETLEAHAGDTRPFVYRLDELEAAATHDRIWNAAQTQLVRDGIIDSYLRMLWGKKILEWSPTPRDALEAMIELNNKYAVDGRDPNSYSGIFWVLGRYDRAWGPERPIFGKVRYMSSDSAARKLRLDGYLERYAPETS